MAALNAVAHHGLIMHELSKRKSWPAREAGVMVVFCIVFVVAVALIGMYVSKWLARRKEAKEKAASV